LVFLAQHPLRSLCQCGLLEVSLHWDLVKIQQHTCQRWFWRKREREGEGEGELGHDKKKFFSHHNKKEEQRKNKDPKNNVQRKKQEGRHKKQEDREKREKRISRKEKKKEEEAIICPRAGSFPTHSYSHSHPPPILPPQPWIKIFH